jgi:ribosomal subunit interface protein
MAKNHFKQLTEGTKMIKKLEISAQHTALTPQLKKYITAKIGRLDRYVSRHARESVHAEVHLKEAKAKDRKQFICNVVLHLPHGVIDASENTVNMFAAVDIVETKLKNQLKKYKDTQTSGKLHRRVFARISRKNKTSMESLL